MLFVKFFRMPFIFQRTVALTNTPPCLAFVRWGWGGSLRKCCCSLKDSFFLSVLLSAILVRIFSALFARTNSLVHSLFMLCKVTFSICDSMPPLSVGTPMEQYFFTFHLFFAWIYLFFFIYPPKSCPKNGSVSESVHRNHALKMARFLNLSTEITP